MPLKYNIKNNIKSLKNRKTQDKIISWPGMGNSVSRAVHRHVKEQKSRGVIARHV